MTDGSEAMREAMNEAMREAMREAIARYLDGEASAAEREAVERALLDEDAGRLLAEALCLRHLLTHAPPLAPPPDVLARWEAAVLDALDEAEAPAPGRWLDAALDALGWTVRGPALSLSAAGTAQAREGLSTLRYGLPALRDKPPPRPWWRRVLPGGGSAPRRWWRGLLPGGRR